MGNSVGPKGFSIGSRRQVSSWKYPKSYPHERDEPDVLAHLGHTDILTGEGVAQIDFTDMEAGPAAMGHGELRVVKRVRDFHAVCVRASEAHAQRWLLCEQSAEDVRNPRQTQYHC